jgi:hypothetical protein
MKESFFGQIELIGFLKLRQVDVKRKASACIAEPGDYVRNTVYTVAL